MEFIDVQGQDIEQYLGPMAFLRQRVFREYPYLYDGNIDDEKEYLSRYVNCPESLAILIVDDGNLVGMSSCLPLKYEDEKIKTDIAASSLNVETIGHFGESLLLESYRGHGFGKMFFMKRENHCKKVIKGCTHTAFCSVDREEFHPLKPQDFRSPEGLWQRMGYSKMESLKAHISWKDINKDEQSEKSLTFWLKAFDS